MNGNQDMPEDEELEFEQPFFADGSADRKPVYPWFSMVVIDLLIILALATIAMQAQTGYVTLFFVGLGLVGLSYLYGRRVRHELVLQSIGEYQRRIPLWRREIPNHLLGRVLRHFKPDPRNPSRVIQEVLIITRRTKWYVVLNAGGVWLALGALLYVAAFTQLFSTFAVIVGVIAATVVTVLTWLRWSSMYIVITNLEARQITEWPPELFWMPTEPEGIDIASIDARGVVQGFWGRILNFGAVKADTASQSGDLRFNRIRWVPYPEVVGEILYSAKHSPHSKYTK